MLTNRFVKSCKSVRLSSVQLVPSKLTQFYTRGHPFDVRSVEMEFRLHYTKPCATAKVLEALQPIRMNVNRLFSFFQHICFVESGTCVISLKAIDKRSDYILIVDTDKFLKNEQPHFNYFFWCMVLGPLVYLTLQSFEVDSEYIRSLVGVTDAVDDHNREHV